MAQAPRRHGRGRRDDRRRHDRQGRRRDPVPRRGRPREDPRRARRDRAGRRGDRRDRPGGGAGDADAEPRRAEPRQRPATSRQQRGGRPLRRSSRPSCAGWRTSTASTSRRSKGTASAVGSARRTCSRTSRQEPAADARPSGRFTSSRHSARAEPPAPPATATSRRLSGDAASRCRRCARRSPSTWCDSRHEAAHCTTIVEVDFSAVAARRAELKEAYGPPRRAAHLPGVRRPGGGRGARGVPDRSTRRSRATRSSSTTTSTSASRSRSTTGLIVPVIPQAQRLSLEGMAAAIADVAERGPQGKLSPDDVQGGTFTITNPGQFGAVLATPIINQPQVAILDLEAIVKRPVVVESRRERRDRDQADGVPAACPGTTAPSTAPRQPASSAPSRTRLERRERCDEGDRGTAPRDQGPVRPRPRGARSSSAASEAARPWRSRSTPRALGPALGGARLWHYERDDDGDRGRAPARARR